MQSIEFHYELPFVLDDEKGYRNWIIRIVNSEVCEPGEINYIFCSDDYLLELHKKHLQKETFTDIITFDNSTEGVINGDIFISIDRVRENAKIYNVEFRDELKRVMSHGLLHMMGYKDKEDKDIEKMRLKEEEKMRMFHVEL